MAQQYFPSIVVKKRLKEDATDNALEVDAVYNHICSMKEKREIKEDDTITRLHATSPLQTSEDINKTIRTLLTEKRATSAAFVKAEIEPEKLLEIKKTNGNKVLVSVLDGKCESVTPVNRQTCGAKYQRANIITCYAKTILDSRTLTGKYCYCQSYRRN